MPFSNSAAAQFGLLAMHAMDMHRTQPDAANAPFSDPWLEARGWQMIGTLHGRDTIFPVGVKGRLQLLGYDTCYGYLARHELDGRLAVALRGTDGLVEWLEDGEFLPVAPMRQPPFGPPEARVEQGFWDIFDSMTLRGPGGTAQGPVVGAILPLLQGADASLVVVGHSLGAALGTYLTLELALAAPRTATVQACLFASPRTGNKAFVQAFDQAVGYYRLFNYLLDVVPRIPFGPEYEPLPRRTVIQPSTAEAAIRMTLACNHHVICYCAMLDYEGTMDVVASPPAGEEGSALCVLGPETGAPSMAKTLATALASFVPV